MAISFPAGPASVPVDLTQPPATYRRRVALAMAGLVLFLVLYLLLTGWLGFTAYRLIAASVHGGNDAFWGFIVGAGAAFLTVFMVKGIFFMKHGRAKDFEIEVTPADQPALFEFLHTLADQAGAPRPHRVFLSPRVNASVSYDLSLLNLVFPSKKNLEIGLGLVNTLTLAELKAVLAHEFGHFTQRSMAVGRWVATAQQIAAHIVAKRDKLDRFLGQFSRIDIRIAWIGWILSLVIWAIRSLVDSIFSLALRMHRALSREMEFHADLVAVSLTGSDAPIYALHRLRTADDAWDRTLVFASSELSQGRQVVDLYAVQTRVIEHMTRLLSDETYRPAPPLPASKPQSLRLFQPELAEPPRMWATHPPNDEREVNAKRVYVPAPLDDRSGWLLFADSQALREKLSAMSLGKHENATPMDTGAALAEVDSQFGRESLNPRYRGIYVNRPVARATARPMDIYDASLEGAEVQLGALYPESLSRYVERLRRVENEKSLLEGVKNGALEAPGGVVRHRGRQLGPKALPQAIDRLEKELASLRQKLAEHDRRCRTAHRAAAARLERGWERYLIGLTTALHYAEHNEANIRDAQRALRNCVAIATATGRVGKKDVAKVVSAAKVMQDALVPVYQRKAQLLLDPTLLERLGVESWASMLEELKLGAPAQENIGKWIGVVDGWVTVTLVPLGKLRRAALDQLLLTEARVAEWLDGGAAPEEAPPASTVPDTYPVLVPGQERALERELHWWKRFQVADGVVPATARFLVAASIIGAVLGFGTQVGSATVTIYNGLGRPVVVSASEHETRVEAFSNVSLSVPPGPLHIKTATAKGQPIESFDANVTRAFANYVYNVASAGALIEWTQTYGDATGAPPNVIGAPRWTETGATKLFTDPPKSISTNSGGGTVQVLSGLASEFPGRILAELPTEGARRPVILAHARWDASNRRYTMAWLALARSLPNFRELLAARRVENPDDMLSLRAEQDAVMGSARDSVCARDRELASASPNDADLQYLATRCIPDVAERNRAFRALREQFPKNVWLAFAAAYTMAEEKRWADALPVLESVREDPSMAGIVASDIARLRRMVNGPDADLNDIKGLSDELSVSVSLETGEGEGLAESPYRAYVELKQGRLTQALARARRTPVLQVIWPMLAASDGADPAWADSALATVADSSLGVNNVWAMIALSEQRHVPFTKYEALAKRSAGDEADSLFHFIERLRTTKDAAAEEESLGRLSLRSRGLAYSIGSVILGSAAPAAWREGAKRLLFASERPYFQ